MRIDRGRSRHGRKVERQAGIVLDASRIESLRVEIGPVDLVRAERVAALRAALVAGRFRMDPERTARAVLRETIGQLLA